MGARPSKFRGRARQGELLGRARQIELLERARQVELLGRARQVELLGRALVTPRIPVRPDWRIRTGFRDARLRTGTLFFFFLKANWHLWVWPTSYNRVKISHTFTESHLHIQN